MFYKNLSKSITVKDIVNPVKLKCEDTTTLQELIELYNNYGLYDFEFCIIQKNKEILGYLALEEVRDYIEYDQEIGDFTRSIKPEMMVSETTPAISLPPMFQKSDVLFVISDDKTFNFLTFRDFEKIPMRLALIVRIFEFEDGIIYYLLNFPTPEDLSDAISTLGQSRIQHIQGICKDQNGNISTEKFLTYINLKEKMNIIKNFPQLLRCFPFETSLDYEDFFINLTNLRNRIAHSDRIVHIFKDPEKFSEFIMDLDRSIDAIYQIINN